MGTETSFLAFSSNSLKDNVKLNNPLMGTETNTIPRDALSLIMSLVKLNNPLMGTETWLIRPLNNGELLKVLN